MPNDFKTDLHNDAVAALRVITEEIGRLYPGHDHAQTMIAFLAGVYNGFDYPFNLCRLREIDGHIAMACIRILRYNTLRTGEEIHEWGVFRDVELLQWIKQSGLRAKASRR